jgi:cation-transporting P-type ATPase 13A2
VTQLYSGPVAESLPTSVSAFSHRRARADSTTSFTYYDDDNEQAQLAIEPSEAGDYAAEGASDYMRRSMSDVGDLEFGDFDEEDSADRDYEATQDDYLLQRRSSTFSRASVHGHLLRRDSTATAGSMRLLGRTSQKLYLANEDLTIAIAGFRTSYVGYAIYLLLCISTGGLAYLLFRWLPKWYISVLGRSSPLRECEWVVIENQWAELVIMGVKIQTYGRPVSTVFGAPDKMMVDGLDDDNDPIMSHLRSLDYRYMRLCFHPMKDRFILSAGWKDPAWVDIKEVRSGLDGDEKSVRETVFGGNLIDIEQKSTGQLLVDEVRADKPVVAALPARFG